MKASILINNFNNGPQLLRELFPAKAGDRFAGWKVAWYRGRTARPS